MISRALRGGEDAEDRVEQVAPDGDHADDRGKRRSRLRASAGAGRLPGDRREEARPPQERHDGEILEEQDREDLLPVRLGASRRALRGSA